MLVDPPADYANALRGDLRSLETARRDSWDPARRALLWFARPEVCARPRLRELDGLDDAGAAEAASTIARAALLELDIASLRAAHAHLTALSGVHASLWSRIVGGWIAALEGDGARCVIDGDEVYRESSAQSKPALAVEATTLQALGKMLIGDVAEATSVARRASRMAQTEHLWLTHFFASLVLARLRRLGGHPHLAGLIAAACLDVVSPVFFAWLRWERLFAGIVDEGSEGGSTADRAFACAVRCLTGRAGSSDEEHLTMLVAGSALHREDLSSALAAIDPARSAPAGSAVVRWLSGDTAAPPPALCGLVTPAWADGSPEAAPVAIGWPEGRAGRRLLGFAVGPPYERLSPIGARAARPEAVAAALTLAGPDGIERAELFESVYGFTFRKEIHEPSFKVMRHQAKKLLERVADLETHGSRVALRVRVPFAVPDPRCQPPLEEVMLRHLAVRGGATARDLAQRLDVPLRTVQQALKELMADGACVASKEGRSVAYTIEDTTFCEITVS